MEPNWQAVSGIIRRHSATFYYGSLLFRGEARKGAWAVYAACRVGDNAVDESENPAEDLEAWWAGVERAYGGAPQGNWEVALAWALERWDIPKEAFADMREGFRTDLHPVRMATLEELYTYCYRVAGTVGLMIAPIGGAGPEGRVAAVRLGQAMQLTNCLRDVGEDLALGRVYLPADWMARYGVGLEELCQGRVSPRYVRLMRALAAEARRLYREGLSGLKYLKTGRAAVALAALQYQGILDKLELIGWDNLSRRATLSAYERVRLLPRALWLRV
ncbi:MAG: phytoene/squalene synthase family protein [Meiothermus sp.]|uniref:phytoene/squalene synthase family protein n=1 Tax=Meiothermus sp. TaxID=1955249 RepID=UPI0025F07629|nr:phytoene/squalene synthase family protein [Meiothermus sp.]MCS7057770.1 phytoene/squalene synthase family protein [Meiothermus sp.]MCS7194613.1 phytoene/squalene synthase family protein [Meiothermus sp.]MCX7740802.1 phytoene/squalene synthase family protein [Meiothermus sp.]MDW8090978.1 phytoene/squalene synthase family protein [Meiothermus sp.]MDW8481873.1 phytoene/squalene synthase family protein [Meiothermus sp.]